MFAEPLQTRRYRDIEISRDQMQETLMIQGLIECLQSRFKQDDIEISRD